MKHSSASFGKEQVWGCYQIPGMSRRGSGRERGGCNGCVGIGVLCCQLSLWDNRFSPKAKS